MDEAHAIGSAGERGPGALATQNRAAGRRRVGRENLARIVKAAEQVFAETGFNGATMAEIASQSRPAQGQPALLFRHQGRTLPRGARRHPGGVAVADRGDRARCRPGQGADRLCPCQDGGQPGAAPCLAGVRQRGAARRQPGRALPCRRSAPLVDEKAAVLAGWIAEGRMAPIDPRLFFFMIWAMTQHYADFAVQVRAVLDKSRLERKDWDHITAEVTRLVLRAAGLADESIELGTSQREHSHGRRHSWRYRRHRGSEFPGRCLYRGRHHQGDRREARRAGRSREDRCRRLLCHARRHRSAYPYGTALHGHHHQ